jgi:hypothetical protein
LTRGGWRATAPERAAIRRAEGSGGRYPMRPVMVAARSSGSNVKFGFWPAAIATMNAAVIPENAAGRTTVNATRQRE